MAIKNRFGVSVAIGKPYAVHRMRGGTMLLTVRAFDRTAPFATAYGVRVLFHNGMSGSVDDCALPSFYHMRKGDAMAYHAVRGPAALPDYLAAVRHMHGSLRGVTVFAYIIGAAGTLQVYPVAKV